MITTDGNNGKRRTVVNIKVFLVEALCSRRFTLQYPSPSKLLSSERREVWIQEIRGIYAKMQLGRLVKVIWCA